MKSRLQTRSLFLCQRRKNWYWNVFLVMFEWDRRENGLRYTQHSHVYTVCSRSKMKLYVWFARKKRELARAHKMRQQFTCLKCHETLTVIENRHELLFLFASILLFSSVCIRMKCKPIKTNARSSSSSSLPRLSQSSVYF